MGGSMGRTNTRQTQQSQVKQIFKRYSEDDEFVMALSEHHVSLELNNNHNNGF